jgi:hypothetical protein
MSISPDAGPKPINKLLPDLSDEPEGPTPDAMKLPPDHDKDHDIVKTLDKDGDGDHDMDDHEMDDEDEEDKKEAYANEPDETEYEMDKTVFGGNDLHKEKKTYPKVAGGDNPMQKMESGDLRAQIRAELMQRLAEQQSVPGARPPQKGAVPTPNAGAQSKINAAPHGYNTQTGKPNPAPAQTGKQAPAQAQQSSNTPITPELAANLAYVMKDISGAIEYENYNTVEELKKDIDDSIKKHVAKTGSGAK